MAIERWDMFKEIEAIHEEVDRIFQDFFKRLPSPRIEEKLTSFTPLVNVYDDDEDKIVIAVALPGMKKEDIDVSIQDRTLTVSGIRIGTEKPHYQQEWQYGHFERNIILPTAIKNDDIFAEYTDGILTISMIKDNE